MYAHKVDVEGEEVLVRALHIEFTDEKYADIRGDSKQSCCKPACAGFSHTMHVRFVASRQEACHESPGV